MASGNYRKKRFSKFLEESSLHGVKYLTSKKGKNISLERAVWFFVCISCASFFIYMWFLLWNKYEMEPTKTVVNSVYHPTKIVPFPDLIICPSSMVQKSKVDNLLKVMKDNALNDSDVEIVLEILGTPLQSWSKPVTVSKLFSKLWKIGYGMGQLLQLVVTPCDKLIVSCFWTTRRIPCHYIVSQSLTHDGFCCAFRMELLMKYASEYKNISVDSNFLPYSGLYLKVDSSAQVDGNINSHSFFNIYVLKAEQKFFYEEVPIIGAQRKTIEIVLSATVHESTKDVKSLSIEKRKCVVKYMREIDSFFPHNFIYQQDLCEAENYHRRLALECGCIPFYLNESVSLYYNTTIFRSSPAWKLLPECSYQHGSCIDFQLEHFSNSSNSFKECYPKCDDIKYVYTSNFYPNTRLPANDSTTHLNIYFNDGTCVKYQTQIIFTWDQLLASIGGIFSLCLGGSIISIMEICFFLISSLQQCFFTFPKPRISSKVIK